MTDAGRQSALEAIAAEVRVCTNCRLSETRTRAVPGEGDPETEVVFVGEGPGFNEDRGGRPFIGRAGDLLVKLLASIGWRREDVFITNVVKCRPPDNRDPQPDEIAACAPYLRRQLEVLDPAVIVTLGRFSMATFMPGARISQAHGTVRPVDPATGARIGGRLRDVPPGRRAADARRSNATATPTSRRSRRPCSRRAGAGRPQRPVPPPKRRIRRRGTATATVEPPPPSRRPPDAPANPDAAELDAELTPRPSTRP